jgi:uncharacterized protein (TIGR02145 family)
MKLLVYHFLPIILSVFVYPISSQGQTVTIGTQVWMSKNLDVSNFRNGDPIPQAKTDEEWKKAGDNKQPAWCYCGNDPSKGARYGKLYNWYAVNDTRGLAPIGWHIPTDAEWTILTDYLGDSAGDKMKSKEGWEVEGYEGGSGNGNNSSGFSGLPGGKGKNSEGCGMIGLEAGWWSASEYSNTEAWYRDLWYDDNKLGRDYDYKQNGFSVRCLKD